MINNSTFIEMYDDMFRISQTQNPKSIQEKGLIIQPLQSLQGLPLA